MKKIVRYFLLAISLCHSISVILHAQDSSRTVLIETSFGNIKIKLYNETPLHRNNFLKLVENHFYDSLLFHRVINTFMIQGGDPDSKHAPSGKFLGDGDVGYAIPAEFNPKLFHKRGVLAAARNGDEENPDQSSSGCQFYITQGKNWNDSLLDLKEKRIMNMKAYNLVVKNPANKNLIERYVKFQKAENPDSLAAIKKKIDKLTEEELVNVPAYKFSAEQRTAYKTIGGTPHLDGSYTVFGEVIEGMEVVDKIAALPGDGNNRPFVDVRMKITIIGGWSKNESKFDTTKYIKTKNKEAKTTKSIPENLKKGLIDDLNKCMTIGNAIVKENNINTREALMKEGNKNYNKAYSQYITIQDPQYGELKKETRERINTCLKLFAKAFSDNELLNYSDAMAPSTYLVAFTLIDKQIQAIKADFYIQE